MRYLLFISILFIGCRSAYDSLKPASGDIHAIQKFKPAFRTALYTASVDVVGKHLSGLLLFKTMPDSSKRMVFSSEMGVKFFDFEFDSTGKFTVHYILEKMNRKPVINTLRNDFELILMNSINYSSGILYTKDSLNYFTYPKGDEFQYFVTDAKADNLIRVEQGTEKKTKVIAIMQDYVKGVPDTINISHTTYNFNISLKRLQR